MTREQEIDLQAKCLVEEFAKEQGIDSREVEYLGMWFKMGCKWADKNMKERVLDFIGTYFYDHPHVNAHVCTDSFESLEEMKEELIKAMEE